jgi:hypothetical protein
MNYSRLIWVKEVVCFGHKRLTMSETSKGEINFSLLLFILLFLYLLLMFSSLKNIWVVKKVYLYAELVGYCITTRTSKRGHRNTISVK